MNRNKSNWSAMGIEVQTEQSQLSKDYEKLRTDLKIMIGKFGLTEVVKEIRKLMTEEQQ